ncbi:formylglycine-generating enzyme family protein [Flavimarina sp. Hel_I_48]|uniref:formylglycine-generating enzyme family protein n=1 Tax=Flavimarina sp. Hel_I_48 TaxID=1392488 RepID=UPI0004DF383A|nr:SUMF1/EgtB/PvdO family nonheme iron enzyme [Flavimarina sp. Hel_I_48]
MRNRTQFLLFIAFSYHISLFYAQDKRADYDQEIGGTKLSIAMVAIPQGTFIMGSNDTTGNTDEHPKHTVAIDSFYISKYEITWDLYNLYLNRRIDDQNSKTRGKDVMLEVDAVAGATIPYVDMSLGMGTGEDLPVGNITAYAASKFCEWLSAMTGYFYRLPTEAEWEYSARAGSDTPYFFGDSEQDLTDYAWFYSNSEDTYHKVGQKKPNPWGLYDIYGNVAEWTLDQYLPEIYAERKNDVENPLETPTKEYPRVVRGGSYYDYAEDLRSAARMPSSENWKMRDPQFPKSKWWNTDAPYVGFRIVRQVNPPAEAQYSNYWDQ